MKVGWALSAALLAGCAAGGEWIRPGADEAAAALEYEDCREIAKTAVRTDVDIDQDIRATRGIDWQRGGLARIGAQNMQNQTRDRAAAIVASCMQARGFTRAR
jgi:hypothetical protein